MEKKHFSISEAMSWGFKAYFNNIVFLLLLGLAFLGIYAVFSILSTLLLAFFAQHLHEDSPLILVLLAGLILCSAILFAWLALGFMKILLDIYDYGKADCKTLFSQRHLVLPFIAASFLFGLLIGLGTALFIIPGIYFLCRFFFYNYAMVDKGLGILEAFQESSRLTEGARWEIFGLIIACWFINIFPFLIPATMLAMVYAYRKQQENTLRLPATVQEK